MHNGQALPVHPRHLLDTLHSLQRRPHVADLLVQTILLYILSSLLLRQGEGRRRSEGSWSRPCLTRLLGLVLSSLHATRGEGGLGPHERCRLRGAGTWDSGDAYALRRWLTLRLAWPQAGQRRMSMTLRRTGAPLSLGWSATASQHLTCTHCCSMSTANQLQSALLTTHERDQCCLSCKTAWPEQADLLSGAFCVARCRESMLT